jgi:hypothetical protein
MVRGFPLPEATCFSGLPRRARKRVPSVPGWSSTRIRPSTASAWSMVRSSWVMRSDTLWSSDDRRAPGSILVVAGAQGASGTTVVAGRVDSAICGGSAFVWQALTTLPSSRRSGSQLWIARPPNIAVVIVLSPGRHEERNCGKLNQ